ncbi:MAG: hypothetical protein RIT17_1266 [Pseudomonadota bacterium]
MNTKRMIVAGAVLVSLSGCATYSNMDGAYDPEGFGEANRQSYAAMVVNPEPVYTEDATSSGDKAADAVKRYNEDAVKQPDRVSSTDEPDGG